MAAARKRRGYKQDLRFVLQASFGPLIPVLLGHADKKILYYPRADSGALKIREYFVSGRSLTWAIKAPFSALG